VAIFVEKNVRKGGYDFIILQHHEQRIVVIIRISGRVNK
jgi:hypothetical protein